MTTAAPWPITKSLPASAGLLVLLAGTLVFAVASPGRAQSALLDADGCPQSVGLAVPDDTTLEADGAVIGEVEIRSSNVFDPKAPGENRAAFRLVNRLHRITRPRVIEHQVPIRSGEAYSRRRLREAGRTLRANRFLWDAEVCPVRYHDRRVDVVVFTHDVWTLTPSFSFGRSGGENSQRFEIEDYNLFGTGREVAIRRSVSVDRSVALYRFRDPNFLGSHARLELGIENNSDGAARRLSAERPFDSLDTRWATGFSAIAEERVDTRYTGGEAGARFRHQAEFASGFWGRSTGLEDGKVRRLRLGATYDRHRFAADAENPAPATLPVDRTFAYPWIELELIQDRFVEAYQMTKIGRTEDFNLGTVLRARLGISAAALGADRNQAVFDLEVHRGWQLNARSLLLAETHVSGRWGRDGGENVLSGGSASYFWRDFGEQLLSAHVEFTSVREPDHGQQLLLGGDNGLRGYPLRFQDGDRRFLFTLEQRIFTPWHLFKLFRVGAAAFFDLGRAWFPEVPAGDSAGMLKDLGLGLRLSSSRSGRGGILHFDLAFPLDGPSSIDKVQFLVSTHETF